jgi:pyruvate/2-oxoglutarate dehydrogenase complex dihydrolipoamide dehydrogenase (E3) component
MIRQKESDRSGVGIEAHSSAASASQDAPSGFPIQPFDEHNRDLVQNVHPPEWVNPEPKGKYHLLVVGAGTGGLVSAAIGAALGARVALVERHLMGGDCLNVGCVPSKAIIRAARGWQSAREAQQRFGGPEVRGDGDFAAAMERMRRIRAEISHVDSAERFRDLGVDVFLGDARFAGPDRVEVGGKTLHFRRAVIATGGRAAAPSIPGLEEVGYLTNETVFSLTKRPDRLLVIGGGPIGCELAHAFVRLGTRVTILDLFEQILGKDDPDAAAIVRSSMERDGVEFIMSAQIQKVERAGDQQVIRYSRDGKAGETAGDLILVAAGRAPNVEGLDLEKAQVRYDRKGIETDDRLRTSNYRIYAVGDVCSKFQFTHTADAQARIVVPNALFFGRGDSTELIIPWCTYTSPELAHVGISADDVRKRGDEVETITVALDDVDRARLDGEDEGFLRVHLKSGTDEILGATLVAAHAGEIISQITQAMTAGIGLGQLGKTIFPYPTQAEAIRKAADQWRRKKLTPFAKSVFDTYFRVVV